MATVIAISNQKGGVGKTTSAIHLAAALTLAGQTVLLIDLDSQANATTGLGVPEGGEDQPGSYKALAGDEAADKSWTSPSVIDGLSVLPASLELAGIDLELGYKSDGTTRLTKSIEALKPHFDWIVIDCPPSLGMLSVNALVTADHVVTPLPPERFAIDGLERLQDTMWRLREAGRIKATDPLILLNRVQNWSENHNKRKASLRKNFGKRVLLAEIPMAPGIEDASDQRRPVFMDIADSNGGDAYLFATAELMLTCDEREVETGTVMQIVDGMKAEQRRRYPRIATEKQRDVTPNMPMESSWLSRGILALRFGRYRHAAVLGGGVILLGAVYLIGIAAI